MHVSTHRGLPRYTIDPGEQHIAQGDVIISTLLGSCVAACLWDPLHGVFGMNHFLLAHQRYARNLPVVKSDAGRYGIHAMELLINDLLKAGASRDRLQAKVFGGGNVLTSLYPHENFTSVGDVNSRFIVEFLQQENIPLRASDLGGLHGRVINFVGTDFSVYLKRIQSQASEQRIIQAEHQYHDKELTRQSEQARNREQNIHYW